MKKHSAGALTDEQKTIQNNLYQSRIDAGVEYDYLFIGTGNAALTCATLLANAGYKVCMLEAHNRAGGYAHSFTIGQYTFCAQVHYIWGCGKGGSVYEFLKKIGLEEEIQFDLFDPQGYDHMIMPDGIRVKVPCSWKELQSNIEQAYPQTTGLDAFFKIIKAIRKEAYALPRTIYWWDYLLKGIFFPTHLKYRHASLQDVFDGCGVSLEAQTILAAQAGDFLLPPNKLSVLFYVGLLGGYGTGAYAPTLGFSYYINRLTRFLTDQGSDLYFEEQVTKITTHDRKISGVSTTTGKTFAATNYICGMDPQAAAKLIGWEHFPERDRNRLSYEYSDNGVMVYLGLKPGFEPAKYGLGNHNTWHCFDWGMNQMWKAGNKLDVENAWLFISTPTTHSTNVPQAGHIIEIGTYAPYAPFKQAAEKSHDDYRALKMEMANKMIDLVTRHHIPDLNEHIALKVVGSPTTSEDFCRAPFGNAYGAALLPKSTTSRLSAKTPFSNLHWCNATAGIPSIYGTVRTGCNLYMDLTGDEFYDSRTAPTDEEFIASLLSVSGRT